MPPSRISPPRPKATKPDPAKIERVLAEARKAREARERDYRERSLAIHGWICARCARDFDAASVHLLTVHHRDGNHDNNPPDGSNWENLCVWCHENEHARGIDHDAGGGAAKRSEPAPATHNPFAGLGDLLRTPGKP